MPRQSASAKAAAAAATEDDASRASSRPALEDSAKVTKPSSGKGSGKRGRPKMDPALRKTASYVPTGRPRGRPPKDASQTRTSTSAKPAPAPGAGRGRGRPVGSTKKSSAAGTPAKKAAAADASGTPKTPGKRGRKSKATLEAERLEREAAAAATTADDDDDDDDEEEDSDLANGTDDQDIGGLLFDFS